MFQYSWFTLTNNYNLTGFWEIQFFKLTNFPNCLFQSQLTNWSNFWNCFDNLPKRALRLVNLIYYSKSKFDLMVPIPLSFFMGFLVILTSAAFIVSTLEKKNTVFKNFPLLLFSKFLTVLNFLITLDNSDCILIHNILWFQLALQSGSNNREHFHTTFRITHYI